jgi:hypothetical protein
MEDLGRGGGQVLGESYSGILVLSMCMVGAKGVLYFQVDWS